MGTAMNSGKTTMAASLVRGLTAAGLKTGAAKVMGTGAGPDTWFYRDAGADPALDIVDAGLGSTYMESPDTVRGVFRKLQSHLTAAGVDAMVLEVADSRTGRAFMIISRVMGVFD